MHTLWYKGDFNVEEAKRYNELLRYLSCIVPYIIKNLPISIIVNLIDIYYCDSRLSAISDDRHRINVSIASAGLKLFLDSIGLEELNISIFNGKLEEYINAYEKNAQEDEIDRYWLVLREIISSPKYALIEGLDYKQIKCNGEVGLHIYTGKEAKKFIVSFNRAYKNNFEDSRPLKHSDYANRLKVDYGIRKESATYKDGQSRYGIFIPYSVKPDIECWLKKDGATEAFSRKRFESIDLGSVGFKDETELF